MNLRSIALIAAIPIVCGSLVAIATGDPDEARTTTLDLEIVDDVLRLATDTGLDLEVPAEWVSLDYLAAQLPRAYRARLPKRDAWRTELFVASREHIVVVASAGPDGILDLASPQALERALAASLRGGRESLPFDDIALVVGSGVINAPLTAAARAKQTMADLRSIATAVEAYSIDNNRYPLQDADLKTVGGIEAFLEPIYIRSMPLLDGWGHEILYWSDASEYVILAPAADGLVEAGLDIPGPARGARGGTAELGEDIVFANGRFVQWPDGLRN